MTMDCNMKCSLMAMLTITIEYGMQCEEDEIMQIVIKCRHEVTQM
jgi:hypothetical protein